MDFENTVSARGAATDGSCGDLWQVQGVSKDGDVAVLTKAVKAVQMARECAKIKDMNGMLSNRTTALVTELKEARAAGNKTCGQLETLLRQITSQKKQSAHAKLTSKKLVNNTLLTETNPYALGVAVRELLSAKKALVKYHERKSAVKGETRQLVLAERQKTIKSAKC